MSSTAAEPAPSPLLADFGRQLAAIRAEAEELTRGLSAEQFNWRPEPGKWSAGEVVRHLVISAGTYFPRIDAAVAEARARGRTDRGDWKPSFVGRLMVDSLGVPPKRKLPSPGIFRPTNVDGMDPKTVLDEWRRSHDAIEERIRAAAGVDLRRARVVSPVTRLMRMNLGDALALLLTHERRHLWQLRRLREHPHFPAAQS